MSGRIPGTGEVSQLRQNVAVRQIAQDLKVNYAPLDSPAFTTPDLGVATATSLNGLTITNTSGTLTIAAGKTLTWSNTITIAGTDGSTLNVGTGGTLAALAFLGAAPAGTLTGTTLAANVVTSSLTAVGTLATGTWQATAVGVAYGGTGAASLAANNVILGNGTSPVQLVAPGASGNVLTSDGTTWQSSAPGGQWTRSYKAADQSLATSNTSYQDVSSLTFTAAAGKKYGFRALVLATVPTTGSNGGGLKVSVNGSAAATSIYFGSNQNGTNGSAYDGDCFNVAAQALAQVLTAWVEGAIVAGGSNITVSIRAAQVTSASGATIVRLGSYIEYFEIV